VEIFSCLLTIVICGIYIYSVYCIIVTKKKVDEIIELLEQQRRENIQMKDFLTLLFKDHHHNQ
jgi:hypothetical protein